MRKERGVCVISREGSSPSPARLRVEVWPWSLPVRSMPDERSPRPEEQRLALRPMGGH